ncbi:Uncharacterized membrane protein YhhN [Spirosomataceae bacterium TFI 002]|nr:Uncharacterized membrane protein YhhN [Spirosomataceae bacterium TFI 002]
MKVAKIVFWAIAAAYIGVISFTESDLKYFLKPSIILSLLVYYWLCARKRVNKTMLIALLFSISGDFWLMFSGANYFLIGLGSFLITHICYIFVFAKMGALKALKPLSILPFGILLFLMLWYLWPGLGDFQIPVVVYASTIISMGFMAFSLKGKVTINAWNYIFGGSLLFIISDSLIALGKFKSDELSIPNIHLAIMVTYILAQFLIVEGFICYSRTSIKNQKTII